MARKTVFLETAFWDRFSECSRALIPYSSGEDPDVTFDKVERWNKLYKFICRSSVYVDEPLSTLANKAKEDPMLKHLLKSNGDGKMDLEYLDDIPFPDLENREKFEYSEFYTSVFFTEVNHQQSARAHGVINISYDSIWNQQNKFIDTGESITENEGWPWNKMEILRENSNGIVLIDNYILTPDYRTGACTIDYNLRELLRLMLPDSCKEEYTLSIFYNDDSGDEGIRDARKEQFYKAIKNFVSVKKRGLQLVLELFPTLNLKQNHKDFHDRTIITNNVWIGSEAGFDLLIPDYTKNTNTRASKSTTTHGLYLGMGYDDANWLEGAYERLISDAKKCLNKYKYKSDNRLLR